MRHVGLPCIVALIGSIALAGPETPKDPPKPPAAPGMSKEAAIDVCGVDGERSYLSRLRCSDDSSPKFERSGSVGPRNEVKTKEDEAATLRQIMSTEPLKPGEKDFHTIDQYEVTCRSKSVMVYVDMYHCPEGKTHGVPPGFTLKGQKG